MLTWTFLWVEGPSSSRGTMRCPNHLYNSRQPVVSGARFIGFYAVKVSKHFWGKNKFPLLEFLNGPSQGKLHKCRFKMQAVPDGPRGSFLFFLSHFRGISKNFTASFVNYISIKMPLRGRLQ